LHDAHYNTKKPGKRNSAMTVLSDQPKLPGFAEVAVALPVYCTYTYSIPDHIQNLAVSGKRVLVPFGHRKITAYILDVNDYLPEIQVKDILEILDEKPLFPDNMIPFFKWMSQYYKCPIGEVIKTALPGGLNLSEYKTFETTRQAHAALHQNLASPEETKILQVLDRHVAAATIKQLSRLAKQEISPILLQGMESHGWIKSRKILKGGATKHRLVKYISFNYQNYGLENKEISPTKKKILDMVKQCGEVSLKEIKEQFPSAARYVNDLQKKGIISIVIKKEYRDPLGVPIAKDCPPKLNREQEEVVSKVLEKTKGGFNAFLLTGVTGSGKTEVYLRLAAETISRKKSVLILVPEIALISQMVHRFRARFGDLLSVLHSGLSDSERYDQWDKISSEQVSIAIGARSAIFAPFQNPGLLIVDEEHDTSYKQETRFRYNARDLAVVRARQKECIVILGSATPSVQSYYNVKTGKFQELVLKHRIEKRPLAATTIVDLRGKPSGKGFKNFITPELFKAIKDTLTKKEQVLLFLNRRGFASYPVCATCGSALMCKNCEITLTFHKSINCFKCHFCGYSIASFSNCPTCGSSNIMHLGLGTEKVEEALKSMFPEARIIRMDHDTTQRKDDLINILRDLKNQKIDILIGTQMVAKGHDFPNITLVGIICADLSLSFPDFRAGERTFQLLTQVAGRAGRGQNPGVVILQTYNPNHFSILAARDQDFKRFYNHEINFRKSLSYPPFSRLVQLSISGKNKLKTKTFASDLGHFLKNLQHSDPIFTSTVKILGPIEAPMSKIAKSYRWQILIKSEKSLPLHGFVNRLVHQNSTWLTNRRVTVAIDVDPYMML
jgi:primosomal protein N' (replication factor Y) (superfamily II helicase)